MKPHETPGDVNSTLAVKSRLCPSQLNLGTSVGSESFQKKASGMFGLLKEKATLQLLHHPKQKEHIHQACNFYYHPSSRWGLRCKYLALRL